MPNGVKTPQERIDEIVRKMHNMADPLVNLANGTTRDYESVEQDIDGFVARAGKVKVPGVPTLTSYGIEALLRRLGEARTELNQRVTELSDKKSAQQYREDCDRFAVSLEKARINDLGQIGRDSPAAKTSVKAAQDDLKRLADKLRAARSTLERDANFPNIAGKLRQHVARLSNKEQWLNDQQKRLSRDEGMEVGEKSGLVEAAERYKVGITVGAPPVVPPAKPPLVGVTITPVPPFASLMQSKVIVTSTQK